MAACIHLAAATPNHIIQARPTRCAAAAAGVAAARPSRMLVLTSRLWVLTSHGFRLQEGGGVAVGSPAYLKDGFGIDMLPGGFMHVTTAAHQAKVRLSCSKTVPFLL